MERLYASRTCSRMVWSNSSPAILMDCDTTMPPIAMTATSVVPPPMSTTIEPVGSSIGRSAPMAAAMGSSIRYACRAPAEIVASNTARFSTDVTPEGTQMTTLGLGDQGYLWLPRAFSMK